MGKKAKEHRKKVQARNQRIKAETKKREKMFQEMFMKQLESMKEEMDKQKNIEEVETSQSIKLNTDGFVQSSEII